MNKCIFILALIFSFTYASAQLNYPVTRKTDVADDYFGTKVADPYRWLEDDNSPETAAWVKDENKVTEDYLSTISFRPAVKKRLTELWNYPKSSVPFKGGDNYFVHTNNGLQNQFVLNIKHGIAGEAVPLLDPNTMSKDGTVDINNVSVSHDGKYLAYSISKAGSDWNEIYVMDITTSKQLADTIKWVKFSGLSWQGNGFYYSRYDPSSIAKVQKDKNEDQKVFYHVLGTDQTKDRLIYSDKDHPQRIFGAGTTEDEKYLILSASEGTSGNNLAIRNAGSEDAKWINVVNNFENNYSVVDNDGDIIYILTNYKAPKYKLVSFDAAHPGKGFQDIIPESNNVMEQVTSADHKFVVKYMVDASSRLKVFSRKGTFLCDILLGAIGTVEELSASNKDENVFYSLTTFTSPPVIYQFNVNTKQQIIYFKPKLNFNSDDYETKQVFYKSKDGTKIPMFIVNKKGIVFNGQNPVLLFGYGGFNISKTPEFKLERLVFFEQGGVLAIPNLRGGGEYGEEWHKAGTKERKQNVFDDFIAAAEYLISERYTNPEKLAIGGRSNGGLLVGAVMTQRPELFKVAIPTVGVMDMLRFHKFTIGWAWKSDYGSSETKEGFDYIYKYSPLHNIKSGVKYPATLVTTGDHDDRVVPAHSFKFIATLQDKQDRPPSKASTSIRAVPGEQAGNPMLIRIDINAGHAGSTALGSGKPVSKQIDEQTDIFSFIMYNLGMQAKYSETK